MCKCNLCVGVGVCVCVSGLEEHFFFFKERNTISVVRVILCVFLSLLLIVAGLRFMCAGYLSACAESVNTTITQLWQNGVPMLC